MEEMKWNEMKYPASPSFEMLPLFSKDALFSRPESSKLPRDDFRLFSDLVPLFMLWLGDADSEAV